MAKAPYKHPSVFVGCPYTPASYLKGLKSALDRVPIEFHFVDGSIKSKHVLERIRVGIVRTDYSVFDITDWNANVTLEVGLAEGLNPDYYILFRPGKGAKTEPPADLRGLQRFQYDRLDDFSEESLSYQLNQHLVRKLTHPRFIYDHLSGPNRDKSFVVAMRMLAHFKRHQNLNWADVKELAAGSYLRDAALRELVALLHSRELIKGQVEGQRWRLGRKIFKNVGF
jgi:hypothetical protein